MFCQANSTKMLLMDLALDDRSIRLAAITTTAYWTIAGSLNCFLPG